MTCVCQGRGVVRFQNTDGAPDEFGICLCAVGQGLRVAVNRGKATAPRWQLWAAREQVDPAQVAMIEEFLTDEEIVQYFGAAALEHPPEPETNAFAIAAAMRTQKPKL
jgi:hypothetical protein